MLANEVDESTIYNRSDSAIEHLPHISYKKTLKIPKM